VPLQDEADRDRALKAASACVAWESSTSRLNREESSQSHPNGKYALTAARILVHYMVNGGFLGGSGEGNRDNNHILEHVHRLKGIAVHIVHGRYDRVCHLYQAEALVRALRAAGNTDVHYFITTAGHSSLELGTESRLCTIMNDLSPMSPFDRGGE
jgi:proline iminopeptidase